jgi:hypothetical protein
VGVATASGRLFLEVVTPAAVARLVQRHAALAGAVPVPAVLAASDDGVLVLPGLPGAPMRTLLAGNGAGLRDPAHLDTLLDGLRQRSRPARRGGGHTVTPRPGPGIMPACWPRRPGRRGRGWRH